MGKSGGATLSHAVHGGSITLRIPSLDYMVKVKKNVFEWMKLGTSK